MFFSGAGYWLIIFFISFLVSNVFEKLYELLLEIYNHETVERLELLRIKKT
jgi:hypothetical protein